LKRWGRNKEIFFNKKETRKTHRGEKGPKVKDNVF